MTRTEPGLLDAVSRVGASLIGLLHNRLELAGIELAEARERLVFTLVAVVAAVLLLLFAVVALTAWVAVALWPTLGAAVLGCIGGVYALAGVGTLLWLRSKLHGATPLMGDTLAELRHDAAALRGGRT